MLIYGNEHIVICKKIIANLDYHILVPEKLCDVFLKVRKDTSIKFFHKKELISILKQNGYTYTQLTLPKVENEINTVSGEILQALTKAFLNVNSRAQ